jgi:phosphatidate cytidylyltransferase
MRSGAATDGSAALAPEGAVAKAGGRREIFLRVATAAILAPLGLWAVFTGGLALLLATAACGIVAAFEWTRMASQAEVGWVRIAQYATLGATSAAAVLLAPHGLELVAVAALIGCAAAGSLAVLGKGSMSSMAFGAIYTSLPFGCFVWIRELAPQGQFLLMSVLLIVWTTDVGAYFAGRGFGGPLLSPRDSPNKTWTGAIGALVCAGLAGAAVARAGGGDFAHWLMFGLVLSIVAQSGDLLESRFKRLYGVKDTSGFVPGHGGVLDRLDGLMAATVAAALIARFLPAFVPSLSIAGPQ